MLRSIGAAVRLHPVGFGAPAAVIAAAIAYLVIAGPVSVRFGHPAPVASHPQVAAEVPSSADPPATAPPGGGRGGPVGDPAPGGPGSGYAPSGGVRNAASGAGTEGGRAQPSTAPGTPGSTSSSAPPASGSSSPAPAPPGSHPSCLDLGVLSVCV